MKALSCNHWTTRVFLNLSFFFFFLIQLILPDGSHLGTEDKKDELSRVATWNSRSSLGARQHHIMVVHAALDLLITVHAQPICLASVYLVPSMCSALC